MVTLSIQWSTKVPRMWFLWALLNEQQKLSFGISTQNLKGLFSMSDLKLKVGSKLSANKN